MIIELACSCGTVIRENGSEKFEDSGVLHFKRAHAEEWNHMQIIKDDAQIEFKMLRVNIQNYLLASQHLK